MLQFDILMQQIPTKRYSYSPTAGSHLFLALNGLLGWHSTVHLETQGLDQGPQDAPGSPQDTVEGKLSSEEGVATTAQAPSQWQIKLLAAVASACNPLGSSRSPVCARQSTL